MSLAACWCSLRTRCRVRSYCCNWPTHPQCCLSSVTSPPRVVSAAILPSTAASGIVSLPPGTQWYFRRRCYYYAIGLDWAVLYVPANTVQVMGDGDILLCDVAAISPIAVDITIPCLSVCLSVTFVHCTQTAENIVKISFAYDDSVMSHPDRVKIWLTSIEPPLPSQIFVKNDPPLLIWTSETFDGKVRLNG